MLHFRLYLRLAVALSVLAPTPWQIAPVYADEGDDEDDEGDDSGDEEEEEEDEDTEQPPVTAGGMFTKRTYPVAELQRPLTLTEKFLEARIGIETDMSKGNAFEVWRGALDLRYAIRDPIELQAGINTALSGEIIAGTGNLTEMSVGIETAIIYDLVDFRLTAQMPLRPDFLFDIAVGFPFRYRPKPQIAIIALDKLMTIHTKDRKPDLTVGVGVVFQAAPPVALLLRGEVTVPEFNPDFVVIPATAAVQFSPNNKFDLGLEFRFGNLKAPDPASPFDSRFLMLYGQFRM